MERMGKTTSPCQDGQPQPGYDYRPGAGRGRPPRLKPDTSGTYKSEMASIRSRYTLISLRADSNGSICGQTFRMNARNSVRRILPIRKWMTQGGGLLIMIRSAKSASLLTITRR